VSCRRWTWPKSTAGLKQAGLVAQIVKNVKVIKSGELSKKVVLKGVGATAGAKAAIEAAGGQSPDSDRQRIPRLWQPLPISWPRLVSSATCVAG
jgi:hypothetical protein